jgi:hypothetical protein
MKLQFVLLFNLIGLGLNAQTEGGIKLNGTLTGDGVELEAVTVINESTEEMVKTDATGSFQIGAKSGDVLVIASIFITGRQVSINEEHIKNGAINIYVQPSVNALDNVEVNNLDAVSLGILDSPAKTYTPAERRLKTAGDFNPAYLLGVLGGSVKVDPILNAISGRTKRLKSEVVIEKKENILAQLDELLANEELQKMLKIPNEYRKGFAYYLIEDSIFVATFNANNQPMTTFMLITLAPEYLKTL